MKEVSILALSDLSMDSRISLVLYLLSSPGTKNPDAKITPSGVNYIINKIENKIQYVIKKHKLLSIQTI
ncbi:hypothetical protein BbiDN127_0147 [Borreliella bissettiae DN127]|uniref:Uncharacterized protein n=1 Tax=Borrelia bissettiae (strain DSM 17990 / CIP 109136 / DN127) TaxID=521010 RepID=G0AKW0_BORBD|nr:hypothetical protein BbiDN127_0147 [Borreliella bissettiae DN127]